MCKTLFCSSAFLLPFSLESIEIFIDQEHILPEISIFPIHFEILITPGFKCIENLAYFNDKKPKNKTENPMSY